MGFLAANIDAQRTVPPIAAPIAADPTATTENFSKRAFWSWFLAVIAVAALSYIVLSVSQLKFNRAEVFFAECGREMLQTANLVTPLYHGQAFFDKPILVYWAIIASFKTFGLTHWAARLPSVVAGLLTVALTALISARLLGNRAGVLAAMILSSSFMFMSFAALCMSDMPLVLFDTAALTLFFAACHSESRRNIFLWLGALCLGLGFLTKGPVAIVLPAFCFAAFLTLTKQWRVISWHHYLFCTTIICAAAVPWFMAAYRENGAGALSYFFIRENLQRFAGSTYDTHKPIWFMLSSLFKGFAPWSLFLIPAFVRSTTQLKSNAGLQSQPQATEKSALLLSWLWLFVVVGFFSLSRGKIDYYALPAYPAATLIVASYLSTSMDLGLKLPKIIAWIVAAALLVAGIASPFLFAQILTTVAPIDWVLLPITLFGSGVVMLHALFKGMQFRAYVTMFCAICLGTIAFCIQLNPWLSKHQAVFSMMPVLKQSTEDARIGVFSKLDYWVDEITFQTGKEPLRIRNAAAADIFLHRKNSALLLIPEDVYRTLPEATQSKATILMSKPFINHSITPGYLWSHRRNLTAGPQLLLVANQLP